MSREKKASERKDVLEIVDNVLEPKAEEPWSPSAMVIANLLHPRQVYVARFNKKQIRFLSEATSILHVVNEYLSVNIAWLDELIRQYARLNKFEDGWVIKEAVNVAKSGSTRMLFNLSRWKRVLFGEESESD